MLCLVGGVTVDISSVVTATMAQMDRFCSSTHAHAHTHTLCGVNRHASLVVLFALAFQAADPFIMCLSVKELLLFIVSASAYSPGASLPLTLSLCLSHFFSLCLPALLHLSLSSCLYFSHTLYISRLTENKEDIASYLVGLCPPRVCLKCMNCDVQGSSYTDCSSVKQKSLQPLCVFYNLRNWTRHCSLIISSYNHFIH